jgi:hypothetical protein
MAMDLPIMGGHSQEGISMICAVAGQAAFPGEQAGKKKSGGISMAAKAGKPSSTG